MRCLIFAYAFPHWKSWQGLITVAASGFSETLVLAAPRDSTEERKGGIAVRIHDLPAPDTTELCRNLGIDYAIVPHSGERCQDLIEQYQPDIGIVLGARVLPPGVLAAASCPILNLHPGILPSNRGLDCVAWAILKEWPQGVTAHLITNRIDYGPILRLSILSGVQRDESVKETSARVDSLQMVCLTDIVATITSLGSVPRGVHPGAPGEYHSRYTGSAQDVQASLNRYRAEYVSHIKRWKLENEQLVTALEGSFEVFTP